MSEFPAVTRSNASEFVGEGVSVAAIVANLGASPGAIGITSSYLSRAWLLPYITAPQSTAASMRARRSWMWPGPLLSAGWAPAVAGWRELACAHAFA